MAFRTCGVFAACIAAALGQEPQQTGISAHGSQEAAVAAAQEVPSGPSPEEVASLFYTQAGASRIAYARAGHLLPIPCREHLPLVFSSSGLTGRAALVGVGDGDFARTILDTWEGGKLYLVDTWQPDPARVTRYTGLVTPDDYERQYASALDKIAPYTATDKYTVWRSASLAVAPQVYDYALDWIYLDSGVRYDTVLADLRAWWPKVRKGGVLAGYNWQVDEISDSLGPISVMAAVFAWAAEVDRQVVTTYAEALTSYRGDPRYCKTGVASWMVMK